MNPTCAGKSAKSMGSRLPSSDSLSPPGLRRMSVLVVEGVVVPNLLMTVSPASDTELP